ncbi:hypothetical protein GCM10023339_27280 [Alloalcanivorax gelatiniphagus]
MWSALVRPTWKGFLALLAIFVVGTVAWVAVATPILVGIVGLLAEGPFSISLENRSDETLRVTMTEVGASAGTEHDLQPGDTLSPDWSGCALTNVLVEVRGLPDLVVSSRRIDVCDGDRIVLDEELELSVR